MNVLYNCFVAFQLPGGCHVTITMARDVDSKRVEEMQMRWNNIISIHPTPKFIIGNYCLLGSDSTIPAYKCKPESELLHHLLKDFHRNFYEPSPHKRCYPDLKTHITVDTPEKLQFVEDIIRGPQKSVVISLKPIFEARNKEQEELNAQVDERAWTCVRCNNRNPKDVKECLGIACDQWRPKKAMPEYFAPPSAPSLSAVQPKRKRYSDWTCGNCGEDDIFGSRDKCHKCGANRPANIPTI